MEKISGILPSNSRLSSVDTESSQPSRPGAPSTGRPVGSISLNKDRVTLSSRDLPPEALQQITYKNPRDFRHSKIAEGVTKKFFETRLEQPVQDNQKQPSSIEVDSLGSGPDMVGFSGRGAELPGLEQKMRVLPASYAIDPEQLAEALKSAHYQNPVDGLEDQPADSMA